MNKTKISTINLVSEIFHLEQLNKIKPQICHSIHTCVIRCLGSGMGEGKRISGSGFLYALGSQLDSKSTAEIVQSVRLCLEKFSDELYGFRISVFMSNPQAEGWTHDRIAGHLLGFKGKDGLWLDHTAGEYLKQHFHLEKSESMWKVIKPISLFTNNDSKEIRHVHPRSELAEKVLDGLTPKLNGIEGFSGVALIGPAGVGKRTAITEAVSRILGESSPVAPIRLYTLFNRQSPIHPFLNSIETDFIEEVPKYLSSKRKAIWKQKKDILLYLRNRIDGYYCFDKLIEDFLLVYSLYLSAYLKMAENHLRPLLFICEDVESYQKQCLDSLVRLITDYLHQPAFIPIFTVSTAHLPEALRELSSVVVEAESLGWKKVREMAADLFPGVSIPRTIAKNLSSKSEGRILPVLHYLRYLVQTGKIVPVNGEYRWLSRKEMFIEIPDNHQIPSLSILYEQDVRTLEVLYIIHLAYGLIDRSQMTTFFQSVGIDRETEENAIERLSRLLFIRKGENIIPLLPFKRQKIEPKLGKRAAVLSEGFLKYLENLWRSRCYHAQILLYYFFLKNERFDLSLEILPKIINRKLDENDLATVKPFIKLSSSSSNHEYFVKESPHIELTLAGGNLRFLLMKKNSAEAEIFVKQVLERIRENQPSPERGRFYLTLASYYLTKNDSQEALNASKLAMIDLEEQGKHSDVAVVAHLVLGTSLLADGKLEEALEYITIADRHVSDLSFEKLLCMAYCGTILFLQGSPTRALAIIRSALHLAGSIGRREWELHLMFLEGRVLFYLGDYGEASRMFLSALGRIDIYSFEKARAVVSNWFARALIYLGRLQEGIRLLEQSHSSLESSYFLSEGYYFQERARTALTVLEKSRKRRKEVVPFPADMIFWDDGYLSIEGRCLELGGDTLERGMASFRAYLLSLNGYTAESMKEFIQLNRPQNKRLLDTHSYLEYFLYSLSLPEYGENESADRLTILNMAWKLYQEKVFQIDSVKQRSSFTGKNVWNRRLVREVERHNLA